MKPYIDSDNWEKSLLSKLDTNVVPITEIIRLCRNDRELLLLRGIYFIDRISSSYITPEEYSRNPLLGFMYIMNRMYSMMKCATPTNASEYIKTIKHFKYTYRDTLLSDRCDEACKILESLKFAQVLKNKEDFSNRSIQYNECERNKLNIMPISFINDPSRETFSYDEKMRQLMYFDNKFDIYEQYKKYIILSKEEILNYLERLIIYYPYQLLPIIRDCEFHTNDDYSFDIGIEKYLLKDLLRILSKPPVHQLAILYSTLVYSYLIIEGKEDIDLILQELKKHEGTLSNDFSIRECFESALKFSMPSDKDLARLMKERQ